MQIISVKEARKLLGQKSNNLTTEELDILLNDLETVVRISVREYIGSKSGKSPVTIATNMESKL